MQLRALKLDSLGNPSCRSVVWPCSNATYILRKLDRFWEDMVFERTNEQIQQVLQLEDHVSSPNDSRVLFDFFAFLDVFFELLSLDFSATAAFRSSTAFLLFDLWLVFEDEENDKPEFVEVLGTIAFELFPFESGGVSTAASSGRGGRPFSLQRTKQNEKLNKPARDGIMNGFPHLFA